MATAASDTSFGDLINRLSTVIRLPALDEDIATLLPVDIEVTVDSSLRSSESVWLVTAPLVAAVESTPTPPVILAT